MTIKEVTAKTKVEKQVLAGFIIALLVIFSIGVVAIKNSNNLRDSSDLVLHTLEVLQNTEEIFSLVKDAESGARGYGLTGDTLILQQFNEAKTEIPSAIQALQQLTADSPVQQKNIAALKLLIDEKLEFNSNTVKLRGEKGLQAAVEQVENLRGKNIMDAIRVQIAKIKTVENELLKERLDKEIKNADSSRIITITFIILQFGLMIFIYYILSRDITDRKRAVIALNEKVEDLLRAEEKIEKTLEDLARSNKELEQFAYVASHDLQEPLRAIAGYVQLIERKYSDRLNAEALGYIEHSVAGVERMKVLINALLSFSRVGSMGKPFEQVDLNMVFDSVLFGMKAKIDVSGAKITRDTLPLIMGDDTQMAQLFQNLIVNAIKFKSENNSVIHAGVKDNGSEYLLWVKDNGIGMEKQYFEKIFVIFQRLHTRKEYPGTGIGLSICMKIVARHHGKLWVESEQGKGSTFYFTIPKGENQNG